MYMWVINANPPRVTTYENKYRKQTIYLFREDNEVYIHTPFDNEIFTEDNSGERERETFLCI